MKNTEVQTSPMHASVPNCYVVIHMLVMLNATKYVIITDVTARLNLKEPHVEGFLPVIRT